MMTGLEKIIGQIEEDTASKISDILVSADQKAEKIEKEAEQKAKEVFARLKEEGKDKAQKEIAVAKSSAQLKKRNQLLALRRQEVEKTINEALKELTENKGEEYFSLLLSLAEKLGKVKGELILSKEDKENLPDDFLSKLKEKGIEAVLSKEDASISGGFIISDGEIQHNMDLEVIFADKKDLIEDAVNKALFCSDGGSL